MAAWLSFLCLLWTASFHAHVPDFETCPLPPNGKFKLGCNNLQFVKEHPKLVKQTYQYEFD